MSKYLLLLVCVAAAAQTVSPPAEAGLRTFKQHCSSCHGSRAQGGRAPDLTRTVVRLTDPEAELVRIISTGIPGTEMAAYSGQLKTGEIQGIVTFLLSVVQHNVVVPGDPARGEALFWGSKGGCGNCHSVGTRGNRVGPDLSRIGYQRSLEFLRESVATPDADIARGYEAVTVVTRDGKTVRGIAKVVDDFSALLLDFSGKTYSFDRSAVRSVTRETGSLMPAFAQVFTDGEITDLLAYLATLGRKEGRL